MIDDACLFDLLSCSCFCALLSLSLSLSLSNLFWGRGCAQSHPLPQPCSDGVMVVVAESLYSLYRVLIVSKHFHAGSFPHCLALRVHFGAVSL